MLIETIEIIETSPCLAERGTFAGFTKASVDLSELLPYLNSVVDKPNYQTSSQSLIFWKGRIEFVLRSNQINVRRFVNMTELYELLDWVKELINDTHERREEITPNYESKKIIPPLTIFGMLPKTNCKKCGEPTCLAFAAKLNRTEARIVDCPVILEPEYQELLEKLTIAMG